MIPLNRPYNIETRTSGKPHVWKGREMEIVYSSREGLSRVYRQLYEERGKMRVAVSPLTCFIAIYPIVANGHEPVFVDIDPQTLNMSEDALMAHEDVQAVQTIYLGGNPMRMDKVMSWTKKHGVVVIEDCAQALGAKYGGQMCGTFGEYAVASAVKNVYAVCGGLLIGQKWPTIDQKLDLREKINIDKHHFVDINIDKEGVNQKSGDSVCCEQHPTSISADSVIVSELPLQNHPLSSDSVPSTESSPYKKDDLQSSEEKSPKKVQACGAEAMYEIVERLVAMDPTERRALFQQRRKAMLSDKIDCAKFLTYFIEHYPASVEATRKADADFWKKFM